RVRSEPPGEPAVDLRTDVARITLDEALVAHRDPGRTARGARPDGEGRAPGIRIDLLRGPRRSHDPVDTERWRDAVRRPDRELRAPVAVVPDVGVHAVVGTATTVEVVDAEAEDTQPATAPVAGIQIDGLVVALAQRQVVPRLVSSAVRAAGLEQQRPELV